MSPENYSALPRLIPLTRLDELRQAGIVYPETVHAWRWLYRNRTARGLDKAFVRVGSRILINVNEFNVRLAGAR